MQCSAMSDLSEGCTYISVTRSTVDILLSIISHSSKIMLIKSIFNQSTFIISLKVYLHFYMNGLFPQKTQETIIRNGHSHTSIERNNNDFIRGAQIRKTSTAAAIGYMPQESI